MPGGEYHQHHGADQRLAQAGQQGQQPQGEDAAALPRGFQQPHLPAGEVDDVRQEIGVEPHLHGHGAAHRPAGQADEEQTARPVGRRGGRPGDQFNCWTLERHGGNGRAGW